MNELARFTELYIVESKFIDLLGMCLNKNIINNENAVRVDEVLTRDVVFYEVKKK